MNQYSKSTPFSLGWVLAGAVLGALAMYAMDPQRGNYRRALVRDKLYSKSIKTRKTMDKKLRHISNKARGLQAEASRMLH
jgi:gas vesicle protein